MKQTIRMVAAVALICALLLSGCQYTPDDEPLLALASFYPVYALALTVTKGVPELSLNTLAQPQAFCPRNYSLSEWDAARAASADVMILAGRGFEAFESEAHALSASGPAVLSAMDGLELIGQDSAPPTGDDEASHLTGANPWLFLSVSGAKQIVESIASGMAAIDPAHEASYEENLSSALARLDQLLSDMRQLLTGAKPQPVALMHEGLAYLAEELELPVAIQLDREPGADYEGNELTALLDALKQSGAKIVLLEKQAPDRLISDLEQNGYHPVRLDTLTCHSADGDEEKYYSIMLENARAIRSAFDAQ